MTYDPSKEAPRIIIVNGYEVLENPDGQFAVMTSDGPVIDLRFPDFQVAKNYAGTLAPGPCR